MSFDKIKCFGDKARSICRGVMGSLCVYFPPLTLFKLYALKYKNFSYYYFIRI